jgi:hypothetical protein
MKVLLGKGICNSVEDVEEWIVGFFKLCKTNTMYFSANARGSVTSSDVEVKIEPVVFTSIEEKVEYLLSEIKCLDSRISENKSHILKEIKLLEHSIKDQHLKISDNLTSLEGRLEDITVGDIKLEVAGILSILWGLAIPNF